MAERSLHSDGEYKDLLKVLTANYRALVAGGGDHVLLDKYAALLRFLKSPDAPILGVKTRQSSRKDLRPSSTCENRWQESSLDELEQIVRDDRTTRKDLACIAARRFSVPEGSVNRSSRTMLVEKLRTLIQNERTHDTIGAVARGERENPGK